MPLTTRLTQLTGDLSRADLESLQQGEVVLTGSGGDYAVWVLAQAPVTTVWEVLTAYEEFPDFLPAVVAARVLERRDNRVWVERKDRRKIGWMPIKVKIVTENIEIAQERIDYRMVEGTLDEMEGSWRLALVEAEGSNPVTLLVQAITAKANMGPLQTYFYEVFEKGLVETMTDLRVEMERRNRTTVKR